MTEAQYFEQFAGDTRQERLDPQNFKDVRVYDILNDAGLLSLPDFAWTSFGAPYSKDQNMRVHMVSLASHQEMLDLLKVINRGDDFPYRIENLDWQPREMNFLRINILFRPDGKWGFSELV